MTGPALVWFRDDYRLSDHPALQHAVASGRPVLCIAVLDEESPGLRRLGGAARWWLQWIAGSGPDSAPFHRIFNPIAQGETFDPQGDFVRAHVPELSRLPAALIHRPWEAPEPLLRPFGVALGETYPAPIVGHKAARARALDAARSIRGEGARGARPDGRPHASVT